MLTRKECIEAVETLANGNGISRRNAARSIADYSRILLGEISSHHSGYQVIKDLSIKHKYRLLRGIVPELLPYEKLFNEIQSIRDKTEHHEDVIPTNELLMHLTKSIKEIEKLFEDELLPRLLKIERSPQAKLLEEWHDVLYLYDSLDDFLSSDMKGFDTVVKKVRDFYDIVPNFSDLNESALIDLRLKLRDLKFELQKLLMQGRKQLKIEQ